MPKPKTPRQKTVTRTVVQVSKGTFHCDCGASQKVGVWVLAHLSDSRSLPLSGKCEACGAPHRIVR